MPLTLVATPIGNKDDISLRALECLKDCEVLILEEFKEGSKLIRSLGIERKEMFQLNEHSDPEDIQELLELCRTKNCALISDCGTPNFCDPGFQLVGLCRQQNIEVRSLPGASSLMQILSLTSKRINQFVFEGFLPAKTELRKKALKALKNEKRPIVLLDTPYRCAKTLGELAEYMPKRRALLGLNLTQENESVLEDALPELAQAVQNIKAEFIVLIYPDMT